MRRANSRDEKPTRAAPLSPQPSGRREGISFNRKAIQKHIASVQQIGNPDDRLRLLAKPLEQHPKQHMQNLLKSPDRLKRQIQFALINKHSSVSESLNLLMALNTQQQQRHDAIRNLLRDPSVSNLTLAKQLLERIGNIATFEKKTIGQLKSKMQQEQFLALYQQNYRDNFTDYRSKLSDSHARIIHDIRQYEPNLNHIFIDIHNAISHASYLLDLARLVENNESQETELIDILGFLQEAAEEVAALIETHEAEDKPKPKPKRNRLGWIGAVTWGALMVYYGHNRQPKKSTLNIPKTNAACGKLLRFFDNEHLSRPGTPTQLVTSNKLNNHAKAEYFAFTQCHTNSLETAPQTAIDKDSNSPEETRQLSMPGTPTQLVTSSKLNNHAKTENFTFTQCHTNPLETAPQTAIDDEDSDSPEETMPTAPLKPLPPPPSVAPSPGQSINVPQDTGADMKIPSGGMAQSIPKNPTIICGYLMPQLMMQRQGETKESTPVYRQHFSLTNRSRRNDAVHQDHQSTSWLPNWLSGISWLISVGGKIMRRAKQLLRLIFISWPASLREMIARRAQALEQLEREAPRIRRRNNQHDRSFGSQQARVKPYHELNKGLREALELFYLSNMKQAERVAKTGQLLRSTPSIENLDLLDKHLEGVIKLADNQSQAIGCLITKFKQEKTLASHQASYAAVFNHTKQLLTDRLDKLNTRLHSFEPDRNELLVDIEHVISHFQYLLELTKQIKDSDEQQRSLSHQIDNFNAARQRMLELLSKLSQGTSNAENTQNWFIKFGQKVYHYLKQPPPARELSPASLAYDEACTFLASAHAVSPVPTTLACSGSMHERIQATEFAYSKIHERKRHSSPKRSRPPSTVTLKPLLEKRDKNYFPQVAQEEAEPSGRLPTYSLSSFEYAKRGFNKAVGICTSWL